MREREFYATLIEYIEYDEDTKDINREELLSLLKECEITFNPTGVFGNKSWFCREYVEVRSPIPLKIKVAKYTDYLHKVCGEIYTPDGDYEFWGIDILPLKKKFVARDEEVVKSETTTIEQKDIIYDNFKLKAIRSNYDNIEKAYIYRSL